MYDPGFAGRVGYQSTSGAPKGEYGRLAHLRAGLGTHMGCPYGGMAGWKEMSTGVRGIQLSVLRAYTIQFN